MTPPLWLLAGLLLAAPKPIKVAVSEVEAGPSADPKLAHFVTTLVTSELRRRPGLNVASQEDVKNLLGFERTKQTLGCADTTCLAEIGGALGVEQIVTGTMAKIGESIVLVLRVVDVRHAVVLRDVTRRLRHASQDALLDALPEAVAQLYPNLAPAGPTVVIEATPTPAPEVHRNSAPWWLAGIGGAVALGGGGLILAGALSGSSHAASGGTAYSLTWAQARQANTLGYIGEGAAIVGVTALAAGIIWGIWPSSPVSAPSEAAR